jgi:copper resistance protein D
MEGALPVARALHFAATLILEGSLAFQFWVLRPVFGPGGPIEPDSRRIDRLALIAALLSGILWVGLLGADLAGASLVDAFTQGADWMLLTRTLAGQVWIARGAGFLLLGCWLLYSSGCSRAPAAHIALALSILLCGSLAWTGHGVSTSGWAGVLHTAADFAHLVAAGVWVGGLLLFLVTLNYGRRSVELPLAQAATERFADLALVSVGMLLLTGIVNSWMMFEDVADLFDTLYGSLLVVKMALFAIMLLFAAANRLVLTPKLARPGDAADGAAARLGIHAGCEFALSLIIICIVGVLGTLAPR